MDIKERIEAVIEKKGMQKAKIAEKMGKYKQGFNQLITDPKWSTIEQVAKAMDMTVQELLFDGQYDKPTGGMFTCPHCGKGVKISIEAQ